jgi:L-threonylcarbamoyladenylate synthase
MTVARTGPTYLRRVALIPVDDPGSLGIVRAALRAGRPVVLPTDTIYGLACLPTVPGATDALFRLKERPADVPLALLILDRDQAEAVASPVSPAAARLMDRFWPGPLTLVLPRRPGVELALGGDPTTVGVRCPDNDLVRRLAGELGPLAVTSANVHGLPTPTDADTICTALSPGADIVVVDGGPCSGAASTVVEILGDDLRVLRVGAVPERLLQEVIGR